MGIVVISRSCFLNSSFNLVNIDSNKLGLSVFLQPTFEQNNKWIGIALSLIVNTIPNKFCPFTTFFQRPLYQLQVQRSRFPTLSITLSSTASVILARD